MSFGGEREITKTLNAHAKSRRVSPVVTIKHPSIFSITKQLHASQSREAGREPHAAASFRVKQMSFAETER